MDFAEEILENIDKIKILSLKYCEKLLRICHIKGWRLNPSDIIKNAYGFSIDVEVHKLALKLTLLIKELGLYKGFTIEYI